MPRTPPLAPPDPARPSGRAEHSEARPPHARAAPGRAAPGPARSGPAAPPARPALGLAALGLGALMALGLPTLAAAGGAGGTGAAERVEDPGLPPEAGEVWCTDLGPVTRLAGGGRLATGGTLVGDPAQPDAPLRIDEPGLGAWTAPWASLTPWRPDPVDPAAEAKRYAQALKGKAKGAHVKGKGFVGDVGADGVLRGETDGHSSAWMFASDGGLFGGAVPPGAALPRLLTASKSTAFPFRRGERAEPGAAYDTVVEHLARGTATPPACAAGGRARVLLHGWELPLAEGESVAWRNGREVLILGPHGARAAGLFPMPQALAAALVAEGGPGFEVRWNEGVALLGWTVAAKGAEPAHLPGEAPAAGRPPPLPIVALLPGPVPLRAPPLAGSGLPAPFDGGMAVVRAVAALRQHHGLPVPEPDADLAWVARSLAGMDQTPDAGWPDAPKGVIELARGSGSDATRLLELWRADPGSRARLMHPGLQRLAAWSAPDGTTVVTGRVARTLPGPVSWPPDGARDVPPGGPVVTVWIPAPSLQVQSVSARLLGPDGTVVPVSVSGPATDATGAQESVLHLSVDRPLAPGVPWRWQLTWVQGNQDASLGGSFTLAADPRETGVRLTGTAQRLFEHANHLRGEQYLYDLVPTAGMSAAAWWVLAGGDLVDAGRIAGGPVKVACGNAQRWSDWESRSGGGATFADNVVMTRAASRFGIAGEGGTTCITTR